MSANWDALYKRCDYISQMRGCLALVVDGNNLYHVQKHIGFIDGIMMPTILSLLLQRQIGPKIWIQAVNHDSGGNINNFQQSLSNHGWNIEFTELKEGYNSNGKQYQKGNADASIGYWMGYYSMLPQVTGVILISTDGDFKYALQNIKHSGKEVFVVGPSRNGNCNMFSAALQECVGTGYIDTEAILEICPKKDRTEHSDKLREALTSYIYPTSIL